MRHWFHIYFDYSSKIRAPENQQRENKWQGKKKYKVTNKPEHGINAPTQKKAN